MSGGREFINRSRTFRESYGTCGALAFGALLLLACPLRAQDPLRFSLAGEIASRARPKYVLPPSAFFRTGPLSFSADLLLGAEFNDNINLADRAGPIAPESDLILRPRLDLRTNLLLTPLNSLDLVLGIGLEHYLTHSERNRQIVSLAPGSEIAFNMFVRDFRINFHDRFSLQHSPVAQATVSNVSDYGVFQNTAGVSVLWDLNQYVLAVGYDRVLSRSTVAAYEYSDFNQDAFSAAVTVPLTANTALGARALYAITDYTLEVRPGSEALSLGAFVEMQLTNYTRMNAFAGYRRYSFEAAPEFSAEENAPPGFARDLGEEQDGASGFFIYFTLANRLNSKMSQSLTLTSEQRLGFNSQIEETSDVRYGFTWQINRRLNFNLQLFYQHLVEKGSTLNEELDQAGATMTLSVQIVRDTALRLYYRGTQKDSNLQFRDYEQNVFGIDLRYTF